MAIFLTGFVGSLYIVFYAQHVGKHMQQMKLFRNDESIQENFRTNSIKLDESGNPYRIYLRLGESGLGGVTEFIAKIKLIEQGGGVVSSQKKRFHYHNDRQRFELPWRKETKYEFGIYRVPTKSDYYFEVDISHKVYHAFSSINEKFSVLLVQNAEKPDLDHFKILLPLILIGAGGLIFTRKDNLIRFGLRR